MVATAASAGSHLGTPARAVGVPHQGFKGPRNLKNKNKYPKPALCHPAGSMGVVFNQDL